MWGFNAKVAALHWDNYTFCLSDLQGAKSVCSVDFVHVQKYRCAFLCLSLWERSKRKKKRLSPDRKNLSMCACAAAVHTAGCVFVCKCELVVRPVIFIKPQWNYCLVQRRVPVILQRMFSLPDRGGTSQNCSINLRLGYYLIHVVCFPPQLRVSVM